MNAQDLIEFAESLGMTRHDEMVFGYNYIYYIDIEHGQKPVARLMQSGGERENCLMFCEDEEALAVVDGFK